MNRGIFLAALLLAFVSMAAGAQTLSGPASPGQARIYFYRGADPGVVVGWTGVFLNGAKIGDIGESSYFYRDVPPGSYRIGVTSDVPYPDQYRDVTVPPGSTTYVQVYRVPGYGIQFSPGGFSGGPVIYQPTVFGNRLVPPEAAIPAMAGLALEK